MITTENFKDLLACIGFEQAHKNNSIWLKSFPTCELRVDFNNKTLVYPENKGLTVNERQTCNFSAPENFVVFECVTRLLSKGYRPEHIELEPKWKLGHGASGGRADLLVKDNNGKPFLIIECKTWGGEFESEWKNMTINGGQLFSYAQQIKSTQFLCLYTSTLMECKCIYENRIVTLKDNIEYLKSLKDPLAFSGATDVQSLYKAWHVTYNHEYETNGIFEDSRAPYEIGKLKHTGLDLQEISHDDIQKKYHEFATILRQHNISGRENAFDKLINLFLAKIVDELQNADSLMFYWRGVAFDNYYDLQDRIQRLYRDGMQKFLNEEVTYIDKEDIKKAFWLFKNDPDATREKIEEYFRQLKFYTNNDFAFLDVHNQNLFFQNATVLLKIVRMLQDIKLKTDEQNQFLGDLFEGFLDQGVKQSEGQFFTPTPIVKFLVSSLPLQKLIDVNADSLKVIDYACGAGHFLNEYATQIRPFLPSKHLSEYYEQIFGIEKEYRLSKVAKVSSFMYGQKEIQIVYADALAESSAIQNNSFKVLVSNPPYSVKGFLETLTPEERASFELYKEIESKNMTTNNSIEVFFVERAKQLLAPGGVAAIILPSSLVSNSGAVYTKTREIILKYFDVVAIVEFGSGTFGKTGTNTLALFMRRKDETPELAEHYLNRVNAWFNGDFEKDEVFADCGLLAEYCQHVGFALKDYKTLLEGIPNEQLLNTGMFKTYRNAFDNLLDTKNRMKQKNFIKLTADEQKKEMLERFAVYAKDIEREKLYYFMLAFSNPQKVIIVKSPTGTNEMKRFLGYEWSNRKGSEGIKYLGFASENEDDETLSRLKGIKGIQTPLFNPSDLADANKINSSIRANYNGEKVEDSEYVKQNRLPDLIDFSGVKFDKQIMISSRAVANKKCKYPIVTLDSLLLDVNGAKTKISQKDILSAGDIPVVSQLSDKLVSGYCNGKTAITDTPLILFGDHTCAVKWIDFPFVRGADGTQLLKIDESKAMQKYIYYLLKNTEVVNSDKYERHFKYLKQMQVPLPEMKSVQSEIVKACEEVEKEYENICTEIQQHDLKIKMLFGDEKAFSRSDLQSLKNIAVYSNRRIECSVLTDENYVGVDNMLQNTEGKTLSVYVPKTGTATEYKVGDILISNIRPYLKKIWFANMNGGCSGDVLVVRITSEKVMPEFVYYYLSQDRFFEYVMQYKKGIKMPRGDKSKIMDYQIPVPEIKVQKELIKKALEIENLIIGAKSKRAKIFLMEKTILDKLLWL